MAEQKFLDKLEKWHQEERHNQIIEAIKTIPQEEWDYDLIMLLARAYNNLPMIDEELNGEAAYPVYEIATDILLSVEEQGQEDALWHYRLAYALFYLNREEEALPHFERAAELDPEDPDAPEFAEQCRRYIAQKEYDPELYEEEELNALEAHIQEYFGDFPNVYHEIISPDIHVDICVIPPSEERDCYTLVTMGMGAHRMNVPEELKESNLERAELVVCLPSDWKIGEEDEIWYWPIRLLKSSARLPIEEESWLGWGHTISTGLDNEPYAENVGFCGVMLICPGSFGQDSFECTLPDGSEVNFYQLVPLYKEEIDYKISHNADELLDLFPDKYLDVVDIQRSSVVADAVIKEKTESGESYEVNPEEEDFYSETLLDAAELHLESIREKNLPVDEITAYNHLAIYLRWCMEHDLMSNAFLEEYADVVNAIKKNSGDFESLPDLRALLRDEKELGGVLISPYFNDEGEAFSKWYYGDGEDDSHYFPADVDRHAEEYFGTERYNSEEFQDEAYLFVPWNEEYYQAMAEVIDAHFEEWLGLKDNETPVKKNFFLREEEIKPLMPKWTGPQGCFATDRIMVDGAKVGFCYREEPDEGGEDWDSGWRFMAGDESDEYMDNADNLGIYSLNTVCNYDPDILEFLTAPYNTAYERGEDGKFCKVEDSEPEE